MEDVRREVHELRTLEEMLQNELAMVKDAKMLVLAADVDDEHSAIAVIGHTESTVIKVSGIIDKVLREVARENDRKAMAMQFIDKIVDAAELDMKDIAMYAMLRKEN